MASTISAGTTSGTAIAIAGDTSGQLELKTNNGTTAVTIDTSQNVGIGLTPPVGSGNYRSLNVGATFIYGNTGLAVAAYNNNADINDKYIITGVASSYTQSSGNHIWYNAASGSAGASISFTERMRITSSGDVVMGGGTSYDYSVAGFGVSGSGSYNYSTRSGGYAFLVNRKTSTGAMQAFTYNGSGVGDISTNGSNCTFNSTSDYRLKQNVQPMTGALARVNLLKPVTYNWIRENQAGEGFIAHELQEVVPEAVTGTKDAVDEDGNPVYQAIDQSVLVATLTAAIQELNTDLANTKLLLTEVSNKVEAQAVRIAELEGAK